MSDNLDWLNDLEPKEKEIKKNKSSSGSNQIVKLKRENKKFKQKYNALKHHELSEQNVINYFMGIKQAKLYELVRFFDLSSGWEIKQMIDSLYKAGKLIKIKNGWFQINQNYKKLKELDKIGQEK